jgi:hypothetical protein
MICDFVNVKFDLSASVRAFACSVSYLIFRPKPNIYHMRVQEH